MLKLKDIECLDNGSKLEKIELKLTEKIGRDTFRVRFFFYLFVLKFPVRSQMEIKMIMC